MRRNAAQHDRTRYDPAPTNDCKAGATTNRRKRHVAVVTRIADESQRCCCRTATVTATVATRVNDAYDKKRGEVPPLCDDRDKSRRRLRRRRHCTAMKALSRRDGRDENS